MNKEAIDVQVRGLSRAFPAQPQPLQALVDINMQVQPGEFVSLVGPSGCGKSTLLQLIAGLQAPSRGEILLAGQPPAVLRAQKGIGWMAQQPALLPWRTVRENVLLPLQVNQAVTAVSAPTNPDELLELVNLAPFADAYPHTLSGGMQQRAALARTLAVGAALWLMDEPFAALDELTRELLAQELLHIWQQFRPTVLWVTHNLAEAVRLSDRLVLLSPRPGRITRVLSVNLDRPRDDTNPAFQAVVRQAKQALRLEEVG